MSIIIEHIITDGCIWYVRITKVFQRILVRHKALTLDWILSHEVLEEAEPDAFIEKPRKTDRK